MLESVAITKKDQYFLSYEASQKSVSVVCLSSNAIYCSNVLYNRSDALNERSC